MKNCSIILILHNQFVLVNHTINNILRFSGDISVNIIIVDNASRDGLTEWLQEQRDYDYVLCDTVENYADILNTVIQEFCLETDVFLLSPSLLLLPECLNRLYHVLDVNTRIGAVSAEILESFETNGDFIAVEEKARQNELEEKRQILCPDNDAVLFRREFIESIGAFDREIMLPEKVILDYVFRGIIEGWKYYQVGNAMTLKIKERCNPYKTKEMVGNDSKRMREKWGMKYFNLFPNENLIKYIQENQSKRFDVLEVGCDCGANLLGVRNRYPNANLYAVEINSYAARIASFFANVQVGNIEQDKLQWDNIKFDYILLGDVLEHLRDPEATLCNCLSLLKEGGKVIACIPNLMHYSVMSDLINGNFTYTEQGLLDCTHIHFFTFNEIIRMFTRANYRIENVCCLVPPQKPTEYQQKVIDTLVELSLDATETMFQTFQYVVTAHKK